MFFSPSTRSTSSKVLSTSSITKVLSRSRERGIFRSTGFPRRSATYGNSITTLLSRLRSIFAASDAFLIRCIAIGLSVRSSFVSLRNSSST